MRTTKLICSILMMFLIVNSFSFNSYSKEAPLSANDEFSLEGEVDLGESVIAGVTLNFYVDGVKTTSIVTNAYGRFKTSLKHNTIYTIDVLKVGYIPSKIMLDTKVTNDILKSGGIGETYDFTIGIIKEYPGINTEAFAIPIVYYYFNSKMGWYFEPDGRRSKMQVISQTNTKIKQLIKKDFQKNIKDGDIALKKNEGQQAFIKYADALYLINDDESTQSKIVVLLKKFKKEWTLDQLFLSYTQAGELAISKQDFDNAEKNYFYAKCIKPKDKDLKAKLDQIKASKDEQYNVNRQKFDDLISAGYKKELDKDYQAAVNEYTSALKLFPDDAYAKAKIAAVNKLIKT